MTALPPKVQQALYLMQGEAPMTYAFVKSVVNYQGVGYGTGYIVITNMRVIYLAISEDSFSTSYREFMSFRYMDITGLGISSDAYQQFLVISGFYFAMDNPEPYRVYIDNMIRTHLTHPQSR